MRVGGQLRRASAPLELRHPAILPRDGVITRLILAHHHQKIQHQGRGHTLNELRANGFWIIGGSKVVAQYTVYGSVFHVGEFAGHQSNNGWQTCPVTVLIPPRHLLIVAWTVLVLFTPSKVVRNVNGMVSFSLVSAPELST